MARDGESSSVEAMLAEPWEFVLELEPPDPAPFLPAEDLEEG